MNQADWDHRRRLTILEHARRTGNVSKTCRFFGVSRSAFYVWREAQAEGGDAALAPRKRGPKKPMPNQYRPELVEKILRLSGKPPTVIAPPTFGHEASRLLARSPCSAATLGRFLFVGPSVRSPLP